MIAITSVAMYCKAEKKGILYHHHNLEWKHAVLNSEIKKGIGIKVGLPSTMPRKPSSQFVSLVSTRNIVPFRTVGSELISSTAAWMATSETPPVVEFN